MATRRQQDNYSRQDNVHRHHPRSAEINQHDQHPEHVPGEHEHGDYYPERSLARATSSRTLDDLIANAHGGSPTVSDVLAVLQTVVEDLRLLDEAVAELRKALLGNMDSTTRARRWLETSLGSPIEAIAERGPAAAAAPEVVAAPWVNPVAVLDLVIGTAFVAADETRSRTLAALEQRITRTIRPLAVVMTIVAELPRGVVGRDRFSAFIDKLGNFDRFREMRLDLGGVPQRVKERIGQPERSYGLDFAGERIGNRPQQRPDQLRQPEPCLHR